MSTITLTGGREMVNEARALELIDKIEISTIATSVNLSNKSFSPAAASIIIDRIKQFPSILYVNLSDVIAGKPDEEALQTLKVLCDGLIDYDLKEVDLSENALGPQGIIACESVLKGKCIEKLYLCNNGLSADACNKVSDIVLKDGCPPLQLFHFYNNMAGDGGAIAISRLICEAKQLQDFRFSATRSFNEGCSSIAEAVNGLTQIKRLDLSDNNFGFDAAEVLAASLINKKLLSYLNLRDAGLTEEGVAAILNSVINENLKLTYLDLSGNDLTSESGLILSKLFESIPSLEEVYLDDNDIGTDGVKEFISSLQKLNNLKVLSLCTCEITAAGAYAIARAVSSIPIFRTLKIDGNQINSRGVDEIRGIFARSGKELGDFDDNDDEGDDDLEDILVEFEETNSTQVSTQANTDVDELVSTFSKVSVNK